MPRAKPSDVEPAEEASDAATGDLGASDGTVPELAPDLFDAPPAPGPSEAAPLYLHVEDAPSPPPKAKRVRKAKPEPPAPTLRTYRARQAVFTPAGRVRAGEYATLDPDSGLAKSPFMVLVEADDVPDSVAAALAAAEDRG
jgi:hypothetical protein